MKSECLSMVFSVILGISLMFGFSVHAEEAAEEILKAIVKIHATIPEQARTADILGTQRAGSGVVIDSDGHILTIGYLILEAETLEVVPLEGEPISGTLIAYDDITGFGLLRADRPLGVDPMKLGQSSELKDGDPVLVASHGGSASVRGARVISRREFAGYWEYLVEDAIFTSPPHPSFGGAALIGPGGLLLGIGSLLTQLSVSEIGSIPCNMFVPIDRLKPILDDLIKTGRSSGASRPWLGLHAEEIRGRVFALRVTSDGPAEQAGIQADDIILTVNKSAVSGLADFYRKVWALGHAGVDVHLGILRGIEIREVTVRSSDRYAFFRLKPEEPD